MARILFVEDETEVLGTLTKYFERQGHTVHGARTGEDALAIAERLQPDVAVLDVMLQEGPAGPDGMNGFEICSALRDMGFDRPILFLTARTSEEDKIVGFDAGADNYVTKPFANEEVVARVRTHLQLNDYQHNLEKRIEEGLAEIRKLNEELEETQDEMIRTLGALMEKRDDETGQHVVRVAEFSKRLAELYGLDEETVKLIYKAAPLHDAGKVAIPDAILNKPGAFTPEEWEIMKTHSMKGYEIFKDSTRPILKMAATIAKEHHEQWDGHGYPDGLKGEAISIAGRIVTRMHERIREHAWKAREEILEGKENPLRSLIEADDILGEVAASLPPWDAGRFTGRAAEQTLRYLDEVADRLPTPEEDHLTELKV